VTQTEAADILAILLSTREREALGRFLELAVEYAHIRAEWRLVTSEARMARNTGRTAAHDAMIAACDDLARAMGAAGEDDTWRPAVGTDRRDVGDFACQVHCLLGISAR
jgi:hypothetical protein